MNTNHRIILKRGASIAAAAMIGLTSVACGTTSGANSEKVTAKQNAAEKKALETAVTSTSFGDSDEKAEKVETVYVNSDAEGANDNVIVSEWLRNYQGDKSLNDKTDLKSIKNVKGDETYVKNSDGTITWNADGNDIYYQGKTNTELPVNVKVSYKLDGKDIKPEDLAGKSGKVTIRFDYENNAKEMVTVNGKQEEVTVPFAMLSGVILPTDTFSNVSVTNGRVVSDANKSIVVGAALPGLKDSLQLNQDKLDELNVTDDLTIPEYVEITADTKDFELGMTMTMASCDVLSDLGFSDFDNSTATDKIKGDMDKLTSSMNDIVDGSGKLTSGSKDLKNGLDTLYSGTKALKDGTDSLASKTPELISGVNKLNDGASALNTGASSLNTGIQQYTQGASELSAGITKLYNGASVLSDAKLAAQLSTYGTAVSALSEGNYKAAENIAELMKKVSEGSLDSSKLADSTTEEGKTFAASYDTLAKAYPNAALNNTRDTYSDTDATDKMFLSTGISTTEWNQLINNIAYVAETTVALQAQKTQAEAALKDTITKQVTAYATANNAAITARVTALVAQGMSPADAQAKVMAGVTDQVTKAVMADPTVQAQTKALTDQATAAQATFTQPVSEYYAKYNRSSQVADMGKSFSTSMPELVSGIGQLKSGSDKLVSNNKTLTDGSAALLSGTTTLSNGTAALASGAGALGDGASKLSNGVNSLNDGARKLDDGSSTLYNGMKTLNDGLIKFDNEGVQKLSEAFNGDIQNFANRLKAVDDASKSYKSFAGADDDMSSSVKFIIETSSIKADK